MIEPGFWPEALGARTQVLVNATPRAGVVLYWMRVAARAHDNPALDVAVSAANTLGTSVLVYQPLSERSPFASDRHHTFMLEGARDVARDLRRRGIAHAQHVERPGAPSCA
jgi:deoxyribodipyrimidine photolyase